MPKPRIQPSSLIALFESALSENWGYIYGKTHELWSAEKQKAYARESKDDPDRLNSVLYGGKWAGHWVTDCSGLFKWAFSRLGGSIAHGSNTIWDKYCSARGTLSAGKRTDGAPLLPGTAVFTTSSGRHNHIGLYVGNGRVIEAQGAKAGVTTSRIRDKRWTAWGELRDVDYHSAEASSTSAVAKSSSGAPTSANYPALQTSSASANPAPTSPSSQPAVPAPTSPSQHPALPPSSSDTNAPLPFSSSSLSSGCSPAHQCNDCSV